MGALLGSSLLSATKTKNKVAVTTTTTTTNALKKKTKFRKSDSDKEFQHEKDSMYVSVRTIPVAERVAFDKHRLLSVEEWQAIAVVSSQQLQGVDALPSPSSFRKAKLSPSLQQLQLLHKMQSISHVRQLSFSPSMGLAADTLYVSSNTNDDSYDSTTSSHPTNLTTIPTTTASTGQQSSKLRRSETTTTKRDGRYRSIDPVQATVAALPPTPPLLSNKKHRLPLRADVGFPNASIEEIEQKHAEINHETEWEEASPRLIVLVTSDDLGTAVHEEPKRGGRGIPLHELTKPWNGGGLEGMPWAGPELQLAKARNHRHFAGNCEKKKETIQNEDDAHSSTEHNDEDLNRNRPPSLDQHHRGTSRDGSVSTATQRVSNRNQKGNRKRPVPPTNRYSALAPPLDATFSNTFGWRPRPFHDRQPCMAYALACPVRIDFDAGNLEPLLCSLTLYSLPAASSSSSSSSTTRTPFGKASEDFWFPAGDWKGRVDVQSLASAKYQQGSNSGDPEMLLDSWHQRTHKAIFSYQSHDYGNGRDHQRLHVVLQVYKVTHVDGAAAYMANAATANVKNNGSGTPSPKHHATLKLRLQSKFKKRGLEKSDIVLDADIAAHRTNYRANVVYDNFGTQFMTPLCFGVTELFPSTREGKMTGEGAIPETAKWPQGEVQYMQLYAYPNHSESQEDFCERIIKISNGATPKFSENTLEESLGAMYTMQGDDRSWTATSQTYSAISSVSSNASMGSASANTSDLPSPSSKKGRGVLRFMSPRRPSSKKDLASQPQQTQNQQAQLPDAQTMTLPLAAKARLFTSALDVDFLQSMLFSPHDMENRSENGNVTSRRKNKPQPLPKVFVDAAGDSAIMVDPRKEATGAAVSDEEGSSGLTKEEKTPSSGDVQGLPTRKRSSLIRLPALSNKPAGYSDAAEFREVLCLPPRVEKNFDSVDVTPSYRSLLNLLYLYPRLLRLADSQGTSSDQNSSSTFIRHGVGSEKDQKGGHNGKTTRYSIRIRLIQSSTGIDHDTGMVEAVNTALELFHNPAPWAGPPLLNAVYTRIPGDASGAWSAPTSTKQNGKHDGCSHGGGDDIKKGIPLKDEFKLRLPMVLDGSYFLNVALFSVSVHDDLGDDSTSSGGNSSKGGNKSEAGDGGCGVSLHPLAETTIPLSSSTRDSVSGIKATTIIPNGIHRLRLGEFQLQLESRLVSSIHVSDPAVATALRDFPLLASDALDETTSLAGFDRVSELVLVTRQTSSSSRGVKPTPIPEKVPYASLFAKASGSALIAHFQEFFFMHLSNLIAGRSANIEVSGKFLFDNIQSLLEIFRRIKLSIRTSSDRQQGVDRLRLKAFIKGSIDAFDEDLLHVGASSRQAAANSEDDAASEAPESRSSANEPDDSAEEDLHLDFDGGAVRRRHKSSIRSGIDLRIARTFSAMESSVIPFSRVAYGASKADRMRLEAELDHENGRFSYLVDDDETVVTAATGRFSVNEATMADARDAFAEKIKWVTTPKEQLGENIEELDSVNANNKLEGDGWGGVGAPSSSHLPDLRDWRSYSRTLGELGLAKRVQYAAHVMLSPCVAPNVSTLFSPRSDKSQPFPTAKSQLEKEALKSTTQIARKSSIVETGSNRFSVSN
jgi:hypothetical protein